MPSYKYRAPPIVAPDVPPNASSSTLVQPSVGPSASTSTAAQEATKAMPPPIRKLGYARPRSSLPASNSRQTTPTVDPRLSANRPSPPQPVVEPLQIQTTIEPDAVSIRSTVSPVIASATLPSLAPSGPQKVLHDFLDSLHDGLGSACMSVLWKAGVRDVKRLEKMGAERWEVFHDQCVKKDLVPFDAFLLRDEVSKWIAGQSAKANV